MLESLYVLTGQKIDRVDRVSDFPLPQSLSTYTQWAVQAEKENPGLIAAGLLLESLQHEANRHRGYWYPKVDLAANYFNNDVNNEAVALLESAQDYTSSSVGITVSMPIDVSGVNRSRHRQAALKVQETEHLLELQTREIAKEARNLVRKLEIDERRVAAREQSVISSEKAYTATRSGYRVGSRTLPEVLLAQRNVFANRLDLANARYDRLLGEFRLKFLAGALSRQDIETLNQCLE
jgi:outer membrane protein